MTDHVKIHGVVPRIQYTADGTLTTYEFPFAIFSTDDIEVYLNNTKQNSTGYTVTGVRDSDGGSVTFTTAPTNGTIVTIVRNLSIERTSDFQEGGALRADTLNDEFDYQIACQQQIADNLNRSMVLPPYAVANDIDLTLPTPSAGKAIVWNSDGTNLENSTVAVNALESTLKGYKESAESAASTATTKAGIASDKADIATTKAQLASDKADIATEKATEVSTALSTKANVALDNISNSAKSVITSLGMPDYSRGIEVPLPTPSAHFTAPSDGYYITCRLHNNFGDALVINGVTSAYYTGNANTGRDEFATTVPLSAGDEIYWQNTTGVNALFSSTFYPLKGAV